MFIGVSFGLAGAALLPGIRADVAVSAAVLGLVLAIARDGWLALFIAAVITGDVTVSAILCVAVLPAWLVVTSAPHMLAEDSGGARPAEPPTLLGAVGAGKPGYDSGHSPLRTQSIAKEQGMKAVRIHAYHETPSSTTSPSPRSPGRGT